MKDTIDPNLVYALELGLINWFQYFELIRGVPVSELTLNKDGANQG